MSSRGKRGTAATARRDALEGAKGSNAHLIREDIVADVSNQLSGEEESGPHFNRPESKERRPTFPALEWSAVRSRAALFSSGRMKGGWYGT